MIERSDLENVVLGIVWKMGPITPYAIRQEILTSPAPHFSGSAGAIYPLVKRLEVGGLLTSEAFEQGNRSGRAYRTTRRGSAALRRWIRPPIASHDAGASYDPLRTRLYFLAVLNAEQQRDFFDASLAAMKDCLPALLADEERYADSGDLLSQLASQGQRRLLETRLAWLKDVRRTLARSVRK